LWFPKDTPERKQRCLQPADHSALSVAPDSLDDFSSQLSLPSPTYRELLEVEVLEGGASGYVANCFSKKGYLTTDPRGNMFGCGPHDYVRQKEDQHVVLRRDGVCPYLSEECTRLIGHFYTEIFNESD